MKSLTMRQESTIRDGGPCCAGRSKTERQKPENQRRKSLRAERDDDEMASKPRQKKERRMAHEIAIGIIIGGLILGALQDVQGMIKESILSSQIQFNVR